MSNWRAGSEQASGQSMTLQVLFASGVYPGQPLKLRMHAGIDLKCNVAALCSFLASLPARCAARSWCAKVQNEVHDAMYSC